MNAHLGRAFAIASLLIVVIGTLLIGCGLIADKGRIVIAKLDGKKITRDDYKKYLRELSDEDRPLIQTREDDLEALNTWINDQIKTQLAKQLKAEGKIEASRDLARDIYFGKHPESRSAYQLTDPKPLGISQGELNAIQAEIEFRTDEEVDRLLREEALKFKVYEAVQNKTISVTADELRHEYDRRKNELIQFEMLDFFGLQFPLNIPDAMPLASEVRRRLDAGEKFDAIVTAVVNRNAAFGLPRSALQNDPNATRFKSFWASASGAEVGQIIGPVLLPEHDEWAEDPQTQKPVKHTRPAAQIIFEVLKREPERLKTLDEAANELISRLATEKVLEQIRVEHGVEVYTEKMENPAGIGDQYKNQMIDTGKPRPAAP